MSKQEQFEQSQFYTQFSELRKELEAFDAKGISDSAAIPLHLRIQKVIAYVDAYLSIIDWDLVTQGQINNIADGATGASAMSNIRTHWLAWRKNQDIEQLRNAEANLDAMLSSVRGISTQAILPKKRDLKAVYSSYNDVLNSLLSEIDKEGLRKKSEQINKLYSKLLGRNADGNSIESEVLEAHKKIMEYHKELLEGGEGEGEVSIQDGIEQKKAHIYELVEEIEQRIKASSAKQDDLDEFHAFVKGTPNDQGEMEGGLEQKVDEAWRNINSYREEQEKIIASLVENATANGLAHAFSKEVKKLKIGVYIWTGAFLLTLAALLGVVYYIYDIVGVLKDNSTGDAIPIVNLLKASPITVGLVWLAMFFGARRSETNRLYHEYLHKEVVAKSFMSYKQQVEELNQEGREQQMLADLLKSTIETVSKNPSDTLDKKHSANSPMESAVSKSR